jgi:hypothetical protein
MLRPRIVAVIANGKLVHISEAQRLSSQPVAARKVVAA